MCPFMCVYMSFNKLTFNINQLPRLSPCRMSHVPIIKHRTLCPGSTFAHCFLAFDKIGMFGVGLGEVKYWSHWNMSQSRQIPRLPLTSVRWV